MSDRMTSIPFGKLMNWVLTEAPSGTIFGVHHRLQADPNRTYTIFDRPLEMPFGRLPVPIPSWPRISLPAMRRERASLN